MRRGRGGSASGARQWRGVRWQPAPAPPAKLGAAVVATPARLLPPFPTVSSLLPSANGCRPEVCRTYNFGDIGSSSGQYFRLFLKPIKLNSGTGAQGRPWCSAVSGFVCACVMLK